MKSRVTSGVVGLIIVVGVWWVVAVTKLIGTAVPTPIAVIGSIIDDGWGLYWPNFSVTIESALRGFLWGNGLAIIVALLVILLPVIEPIATQIAIISYCTPILALGPIILVVFGGRTPAIFLAAISVFFTTMVGTLAGFRSADRTSLDVVRAYGGGRWQQLMRVQLVAAIPGLIAALKIAAPAAFLGAILGEFLGGIDTGVGVALTNAQASLAVPRLWGLALMSGIVAGLGYAIVAVVGWCYNRVAFGGGNVTSAKNAQHAIATEGAA